MSFSEFVLAARGEQLYNYQMSSSLDNISVLSGKFIDLLKVYYFVGGMPEAVAAYKDGRTLEEIRQIHKAILYAYMRDISKHSAPKETIRIHQVFLSIPQQLAKENKRFVFSGIKAGARAKEYENAIQWLIDAGIIYKVSRVRKTALPLKFYEDFTAFKLFFLDCGLLGALSDTPLAFFSSDNLFEEFKGAFSEQFTLNELLHTENSIYCYSTDGSRLELDFIIQRKDEIVPIEVKASGNVKSKSLKLFCSGNANTKGIRISLLPYKEQDWLINLPLYAINRINEVEVGYTKQ